MVAGRIAWEFRVLGPLEVREGGQAVDVGAARQRALLAQLLLDANRFVPRDALIARSWNGAPPADAVETLEGDVSRLRAALDLPGEAGRPPALVAGPGGRAYRLEVDPEAVDAVRFERLIEQGRAALAQGAYERAAAAFDQALELWRGLPVADLAGEYAFATAAARWFQALHLRALEGGFQAARELGRLPQILDQVQRAVGEHPDRASLRELELRALYQAGRHADALAVYHEFRRLRGEPGLDDDRALEALQRRVLRQDQGPDRRPAAGSRFVGRAAVLDRLRAAVQVARSRRGLLVLLHGEVGVGKSALAAHLAGEAAAAGALVAAGSPLHASGPPAFRLWVQVLDAVVGGAEVPATSGMLELIERWCGTGARPEEDEAASPGGREQQFETVTATLRQAAAERPVVVVLDDLDRADAPSLRLLEHVTRRLHGTRLLVLAVYGDQAEAGGPWPETLQRLRRVPGTEDLPLAPLEDRELAELVASQLGRTPEPELLSTVTERARGNPLFAVELTRLLADGRSLERLRRGSSPAAVARHASDVVRERAAGLPKRCRELLALAAVLGFELDPDVLAADGHATGGDLDELLGTATAARFLEEVPDRPRARRFSHPLVQEVMAEELPRDARHGEPYERAAKAVERAHQRALVPHAERLAHLWSQAAGSEARSKALEYALFASEQARMMLAWEEAARLLELALGLAADDLAPDRRCLLLLDLGAALGAAGDAGRVSGPLLDAASLARSIGDGRLLARAALGIGETHARRTGPEQSAELLQEALDLLGDADPALRSRLLACLAGVLAWTPPEQRHEVRTHREALSEQAVTIARGLDDDRALCRALVSRFNAIWEPDNPEQRRDLCDELVPLAERAAEPELLLEGRRGRLVASMELGELGAARSELRACVQLAGRLQLPWDLYWAAIHQATMAMAEGRFERAEAATLRALTYGNRLESRDPGYVQNGAAVQLLLRYREQGRLAGEEGEDTLAQVERSVLSFASDLPYMPAWRAGFALLAALSGRMDEAWETFQELAAAGFERLGGGAPWMGTMATLAELCAALRDDDRAEELRVLLLPHVDRCVVVTFGFGCLGSAAHFLGQLAAVLGDWKEADDHFQRALERNLGLGAPPLVARTQVEYARMLLTSGLPGSRERALELLASAGITAERLGMLPLQRQVAELARD
jgi:DNA-binding SARP family transcriptional activator